MIYNLSASIFFVKVKDVKFLDVWVKKRKGKSTFVIKNQEESMYGVPKTTYVYDFVCVFLIPWNLSQVTVMSF